MKIDWKFGYWRFGASRGGFTTCVWASITDARSRRASGHAVDVVIRMNEHTLRDVGLNRMDVVYHPPREQNPQIDRYEDGN